MATAGVPPRGRRRLRPGERPAVKLDFNKLTGVGDLGAAILAAVPAAVQAVVEPFITQIVDRHPRGVQPGDRPDVLDRRGRRGHRGDRRGDDERARASDVDGRRRPAQPHRRPTRATPSRPPPALTAATDLRSSSFDGPGGSHRGRRSFRRLRCDDHGPQTGDVPAAPPRARHDRGPVRGRPRRRGPPGRGDAPDIAWRPRHPARPYAGRDRRHRRSLPAHERAAVDRRARRLRRRLPAPRGPLRPVHRRDRPDADDRRPRRRRDLPPDLVAGRSRLEGRPSRQEGRGAPASPGSDGSATTRSGSRRAGSRSPSRATEPRDGAGPRRDQPGAAAAEAFTRSTTSSGSSVTRRSSRSVASTAPCVSERVADPVEETRPVRPCRPARPGSGAPCRPG